MAGSTSLLAEAAPSEEIEWDVAGPRAVERVTLVRLLLVRKDFRNAIGIANVFDTAWPSVYLLYGPASLEVRAEAAAALLENNLAAKFSKRSAAFRGERAVAGK